MRRLSYLNILIVLAGAFFVTGCRGPKLATADEQMARGEYFDASKTYRKIYNRLTKREERPLRGEVAFKMAECHRSLRQSARAAAAYQNAIRYGYPDSTATLRLAQSLHADGKYNQAIKSYQEFLSRAPGHPEAETGIRGARMAEELRRNKSRYIVRQSKLLNSRRADFAPVVYDGNLYFTTTNEKVKGDNKSEITGMKRSDIWMSRRNERGEWQRPEPVEGGVNTEMDEGIISFGPDGSMYLTVAKRLPNANTGVEIYKSARGDGSWGEARPYEITADTVSSYGHPAVSPNGQWLYFCSDMPGYGGKDIWRINLVDPTGTLENLGEFINTPGNEMFPYMRTDSILYFASDGHPGFGGLDLFKATMTPSGGWRVENMGTPVNSSSDDFGITFLNPAVEKGFFSSNRGDGRGYDHIWTFELPDLRIIVSGWVLDRDEEPVPNAVIRIVGDDGSNQKAIARDDGSFSFPLQRGVNYVMLAGAKGYLNARQQFMSDTAEEDAEYGVDFILASISKPNIIENIFFDFDKATLRPESMTALDELADMLRDNPNVTVEMGAHTDRHGSDEYNLALSDRRAKAVTDYLIAAGIEEQRLQHHGYGESRPKTITKRLAREYPQFNEGDLLNEDFILTLSPEDQEAADQINRRTEFQVLSVEYQMF